jgi:hypothetical protein
MVVLSPVCAMRLMGTGRSGPIAPHDVHISLENRKWRRAWIIPGPAPRVFGRRSCLDWRVHTLFLGLLQGFAHNKGLNGMTRV